MRTITDPRELQELCIQWRQQGLTIGLVPTMGFFHAGHLSLMDYVRPRCNRMIVTLFVNPTQFGPGEDLEAYPHDFERDSQLAKDQDADILFAPEAGAMYDSDHATWVNVPDLSTGLCGGSRPIHFQGVCTVVTKLFMLTQASLAAFGEKDWQQLAIIRRMVRDLNIPVEIHGRPIVREADGLAMSSRNAYLTEEERACAPAIHAGLEAAAALVRNGERDAETVKNFIRDRIGDGVPMGRADYIELVEPDSLKPVRNITAPVLAAVAVFVGRARLIDNQYIEV
ncbi:pantoate--beta-alanine ligase [Salidesulfovibrio onnuriiensis]|uniref:pantoate--beta-alanine ligase n=1 Tax=Salidesulfovibrio onnuriiensis TaxID=2583823 RepID=UPI0011C75987|nr:pantoate--beta-alanine ligase [Salidesulfovibrio onnuriiensis]